jgi:hypothetical protein
MFMFHNPVPHFLVLSIMASSMSHVALSFRATWPTVSGSMTANNGARISFQIRALQDDPSGARHPHYYFPPMSHKKDSDKSGPSPGFLINIKNHGRSSIFVDRIFPYAAVLISAGKDEGKPVVDYGMTGERDFPSADPGELKAGSRLEYYLPLVNLNSKIRGQVLRCRLALLPSKGLTEYPIVPWRWKKQPSWPGFKYGGSIAFSSEFSLRIP